jgi:bisphosphoglycerate-dependent phosphoglycerate mutase
VAKGQPCPTAGGRGRRPATPRQRAPLRAPEAGGAAPSESLEDVLARLLPQWSGAVAPAVEAGGRALVVAHSNSLRALVKHLDGLSDEEVEGLEVSPGRPLDYEFDGGSARRYDLGGQSQ